MVRPASFVLLPLLALIAALLGQGVLARQGEADDVLPGLVVETLGRGAVEGENGDDLVLLRVTIEPGASIPASDGPREGYEAPRLDLDRLDQGARPEPAP